MFLLRVTMLSFFSLIVIKQVLGQEAENFPPPAAAPVVYAIETNEAITVDGKLNEAAGSLHRSVICISFLRKQFQKQSGTESECNYKTYVFKAVLADMEISYNSKQLLSGKCTFSIAESLESKIKNAISICN
jgi:hypothetical protein